MSLHAPMECRQSIRVVDRSRLNARIGREPRDQDVPQSGCRRRQAASRRCRCGGDLSRLVSGCVRHVRSSGRSRDRRCPSRGATRRARPARQASHRALSSGRDRRLRSRRSHLSLLASGEGCPPRGCERICVSPLLGAALDPDSRRSLVLDPSLRLGQPARFKLVPTGRSERNVQGRSPEDVQWELQRAGDLQQGPHLFQEAGRLQHRVQVPILRA